MRRHGPDPLSVAFAVGLVLVGLYMLAPIIFVVVNSFNSASYNVFPPEGFSLRWYQNALSVPRFRGAFVNSVLVGLGATAVSLVLGTMSARVLTRWRFTGQSFLRSFFFAPVLVPRIALPRIVSAGNVAGEGAKIAALSLRERAEAYSILREVEYVELSGRADFNDLFIDQLALPG